jgi:predicted metal-binding membrane protein
MFLMWAVMMTGLMVPSAYLGGFLLMLAGIFQWSRLKYVCLTHCRSPLSFLMSDWEEGTWGALRMGLKHGSYCVGCCWILMGLFVLRVMNLLWIATLAGFVLLEKTVPAGQMVSRATGLLLLGWGALMISGLLD